FARKPVKFPAVHCERAERFVKTNGGLVPVKHHPLHAAVVPFSSYLRQASEQRLTDSLPPDVRLYEDIFEAQSRVAEKRRVGEIVQRVSHNLAIDGSQQRLGGRTRAKQRLANQILRCRDLVQEPFVLGELADQSQDNRSIRLARLADLE